MKFKIETWWSESKKEYFKRIIFNFYSLSPIEKLLEKDLLYRKYIEDFGSWTTRICLQGDPFRDYPQIEIGKVDATDLSKKGKACITLVPATRKRISREEIYNSFNNLNEFTGSCGFDTLENSEFRLSSEGSNQIQKMIHVREINIPWNELFTVYTEDLSARAVFHGTSEIISYLVYKNSKLYEQEE